MRATLAEIRHAVESAYSYLDLGGVDLATAVDVTCDYQGIVRDDDRRVVRRAVANKIASSPEFARRRLRA